jgi:peptidoglycan/LPS O-acetylase OafA/YrhL
VFIHIYGTTVGMAGHEVGAGRVHPIVPFTQNAISQGFARLAVPIFFLMSGYLFFLNFEPSIRSFLNKIKTRFRTLLVPFLFWNFLTLLVMAAAQYLPVTQRFLSGKHIPIASFGPFQLFNAIFGLTDSPISFQFWFIRDLMVLVLISPLIYLANRIVSIPMLSIAVIGWLVGKWPVYIPSSDAFLFFTLGGYLAISQRSIFCMDRLGRTLLFPYLISVIITAAMPSKAFTPILHQVGILMGIVVLLYATSKVSAKGKVSALLLKLGPASFFLFAIHEPLQTVLKKASYHILAPTSSAMILFLYFTIPLVIILIALALYRCLSVALPRLTSSLTGGR